MDKAEDRTAFKTRASSAASAALEGIPKIASQTLHEAVLNQLRDIIIEGKLAPGMRINEGAVGASLGVSRTPLREAIKSLASEGLLEVLPGRGASVRRFSERAIADILDVLALLEERAAHLVCERASDADIARIVAIHREMMALYAKRNRLAYFKANQAIHSAIVRASGNQALWETHERLQSQIRRVRFVGNVRPDRWAGAVAEHEEMIAALEIRDGARLAEILRRHLSKTLERVRDSIV